MRELHRISSGLAATAAIVLIASQSASAAPTQVTNVRLSPRGGGVDVILDTVVGDRPPQVFNVNRGNTWTAYVFNTQLKGQIFQQNNPIPGIASVTVSPVGGNGIQVVVVGQSSPPMGQVTSRTAQGITLSVNSPGGTVAQAPAATPATPAATPATPAATPATTPAPATRLPPSTTPVAPLVPNPQVTISGTPTVPPAPVPPLLPRAIAPPVGDIALSQLDTSPSSIDLGTAERIPRLVLRDAPVREVLSLLARAAGMNLAFAEGSGAALGGQSRSGSNSGGPTISLDIENESVQDVFNYVLRIACVPAAGQAGAGGGGQCSSLEATRNGRTIFVGTKLPNSARGLIARSVRLNQMPVTSAVNFLVGLGAESAVARERQVRTVVAQSVAQLEGAQQSGGGAQTATETTTETRVEVQRVNFQDSVPFLRGVQVLGDERTNSITLIGESKKVEFATNQLVHLDSRRRLVAVNVKVIDVNLTALKRVGTSFSFGINDTSVVNQAGVAILNFGRNVPATTGGGFDTNSTFGQGNIGTGVVQGALDSPPVNFIRDFFVQLQAAVTNGNAKILTDPTLVVQEGQTATVNLTQEVVTNFTQQTTAAGVGALATVTVTVEKKPAGLILPVKVDRIDDNGYVSLSVAPSISQPERSVVVNVSGNSNAVTLLSERKLESGQIRLRDGQTLVLSGIIQEQDRTSVTKIPILGDLPLLGALFRRTERSNERREVIVLLTPQVIDDSDKANYGYSYVPGPEVQKLLREQNNR